VTVPAASGENDADSAQLSHFKPVIIAVTVVSGLVVPAVSLWMARADGRGWSRARILSTVLAVVWLLWRPACSAFFKPQGFTQAGPGAQPRARMGSSSSHLPRQL
jgi:hypothetical protein